MFKIRRSLVIVGGSAQMGADTNIYRSAANYLKTDDSLVVGGTAFVSPYGTATPSPLTNGEIMVYHKGDQPYLVFRSGGTSYALMPSTTTGGTIQVRVGTLT